MLDLIAPPEITPLWGLLLRRFGEPRAARVSALQSARHYIQAVRGVSPGT